jgi:hypothetical protein
VKIDHGLLTGMQFTIRPADTFDRSNRTSLKHAHKQNTGIHWPPCQTAFAIGTRHNNRTGTTIAFGTSFFRACKSFFSAQPCQKRHIASNASNRLYFTIENKS